MGVGKLATRRVKLRRVAAAQLRQVSLDVLAGKAEAAR
jgi:hypothetical protein